MRPVRWLSSALLFSTLLAGCGDDPATSTQDQPALAGSAGDAGASGQGWHAGGAKAGTGGAAAGSAGANAAGATANGGKGGAAGGPFGKGGTSAGAAGSGAGGAGNGGASAGASGSGGTAGAGAGGTAGSGGASGAAGGAGDAGTAGSGASTSGTSGSSGASGSAGSSGAAGADAGAGGSNAGGGGSTAGASGNAGTAGAGGNGSAGDSCPGVPVSIPVGEFHVTGTTVGATHGASPDDCEGADTAPDVVYAITPEATGSLIFDVSDTFGTKAYLRTSCDDEKSQIACAWISGVAPVEKGKTYYLFVDGFEAASGSFSIGFTLEETCGNGQFDEGEECDDGNTKLNDGCDATCRFEPKCKSTEKEDNGFKTPNPLGPVSCRTLVADGTLTDGETDWFAVQVPAAHAVEAYAFGPVGECAAGNYLIAIRDTVPASNGTATCTTGSTCERHQTAADACSVSLPFDDAGTAYVRLRNLGGAATPYSLSVTLFPY